MGIIGKDDIWETPPDVYEKFCKSIGIHPEIDVCASKFTTKCRHYFGPDHPNLKYRDGLENLWDKPFFMNPPYSEKEEWFEYAIKQAQENKIQCIVLVFAKTDTKWWNKFVTQNPFVKVYFHMGRIKFWKDGKPSKNPAPYGNAWIVIDGRPFWKRFFCFLKQKIVPIDR